MPLTTLRDRRTVGVALDGCVTMCRVTEAQRVLTTSTQIAKFATAARSGSLISFYAHVTAARGMTPQEYLRQRP